MDHYLSGNIVQTLEQIFEEQSLTSIRLNIQVRPAKWLVNSSLDPGSREREKGVVFVADGTSGLSNFRYSFRLAYRTSGGLPAAGTDILRRYLVPWLFGIEDDSVFTSQRFDVI